ncbi:DndE family protein [Chryseobacterium sp. WLY505]|uniref:DndE family protein n=1 Tax=Chryseobacterium sp. WLY505 TaxID=3068892 RepID=UPI002796C7AE|nr:DndE family protein [Chryseobacterium sp. WLY505]MDQ1855787.1 DndE family protein [Chryseobacterium sp. WLY505]
MRITLSKENDEILYNLKQLYTFKNEGIAPRIAFALSLQSGKHFSLENEIIPKSDGKEFRDDKALFGTIINDTSNVVIFKAILDQHYNKNTFEDEFIKLFKLHLNHGLKIWNDDLENGDISNGNHIDVLLKSLKKGLNLRSNITHVASGRKRSNVKEFQELLSLEIGKSENNESIIININDLREFDNRNIAIAGMAGSGKTQLIKDILYQISKNSNNELKFIFFDYKGEGNPEQLKPFLKATNAKFVDIVNDGGVDFNPFLSINLEERQRPFSIRAFVDTISTFVPRMGIAQENILITLINDLLDRKNGIYPTITELFEDLENYYEENTIRQDTLYSVIRDLSTNIFNCDPNNSDVLSQSLYLNLPPALSDTLRQLVVFLLLRYFNSYFSSTNDCEPKDYIFPVRYVIVIDEAHIYLKNKNARKALEDLLRLLRSKGVIVVMLSQGVEDYKTKDFDFASQVKLPICLNVQNKDYKAISNFVGTPNSKYKLESEIKKLDSGKGLINIGEPKTIELKQWWKTKIDENL